MRTDRVILCPFFCIPLMRANVLGWRLSTISRRPDLSLRNIREHNDLEEHVKEDVYSMEALSLEQFRRRREVLERKKSRHQLSLPPNPFLEPKEFVTELLCELRHPRHHNSGVICVLESSTSSWRSLLCQSIGAVETTSNEQVAPSLERSMKRQDNQFAILFGVEDDDYLLNFTADPLDYEDGTCWIECRIRSADKDKLLVVTGWSLERRSSDGAWLINGLDWQDFREKYRPGIGREEWERICG